MDIQGKNGARNAEAIILHRFLDSKKVLALGRSVFLPLIQSKMIINAKIVDISFASEGREIASYEKPYNKFVDNDDP